MTKKLIAFMLALVILMSLMTVTGFAVVNCPNCRSTNAYYDCSGVEYDNNNASGIKTHYYSSIIPNCNYYLRYNWNYVCCIDCYTNSFYYYHKCYEAGHTCTVYANTNYCPY